MMNVPHVYIHASTLCCFQFHSLIKTSTKPFQLLDNADSGNVNGQLRRDYKACPLSGAANSGKVWRKAGLGVC